MGDKVVDYKKSNKRRKYKSSTTKENVVQDEKPTQRQVAYNVYTIGKKYIVKKNVVPRLEPSITSAILGEELQVGKEVYCRQVKKNEDGVWINNGVGWLQANTSNGKVYIG